MDLDAMIIAGDFNMKLFRSSHQKFFSLRARLMRKPKTLTGVKLIYWCVEMWDYTFVNRMDESFPSGSRRLPADGIRSNKIRFFIRFNIRLMMVEWTEFGSGKCHSDDRAKDVKSASWKCRACNFTTLIRWTSLEVQFGCLSTWRARRIQLRILYVAN